MKKIISVTLVLMCIFSQSIFAKEVSDDVKNDLYALGIMVGDEGGNLRLDKNITRAEAAKMICVLAGLDTDFDDSEEMRDVAMDHWAFKYIRAITEKGLMQVDETGFFNPEGNITNEEIVTMIVKVLGYEANAIIFGGGTAGYVTVGSKIGVTKDMQLEVNVSARRSDAANLIYNALDIPVMVKEVTKYGITWRIMDGKNDTALETLRTRLEK